MDVDELNIQELIDSGMAWRLEGFIGRQCMDALERGDAVLGPEGHRDYYGSYVPSRYEVAAGTLGSVQYANAEREVRGLPPLEIDTEPRCDICGEPEVCAGGSGCTIHAGDWNGETGNHRSCEEGRHA